MTNFRFPLQAILDAAPDRRPGYVEECLKRAKVDGDHLIFSERDFFEIRAAFSRPGLGDRLHTMLLPIAKLLDKYLGTRFSSCAACSKRRKWLNRIGSRLWKLTDQVF